MTHTFICGAAMIYGIEWMKLMEARVEELDSYRMRDGGILSLQVHGDGLKWSVSYYNRSDIEEWTQEFDNLETAERQFEYRKRADKGPKGVDKSGAKK